MLTLYDELAEVKAEVSSAKKPSQESQTYFAKLLLRIHTTSQKHPCKTSGCTRSCGTKSRKSTSCQGLNQTLAALPSIQISVYTMLRCSKVSVQSMRVKKPRAHPIDLRLKLTFPTCRSPTLRTVLKEAKSKTKRNKERWASNRGGSQPCFSHSSKV